MINKSKAGDTVSATVERNIAPNDRISAGGVFHVQCFDKDGNLKWEEKSHNLVVNQGLQSMNAVYFSSATQITSWFIGLVTGPGSGTTYSANDTIATHAGWTEFTTYTGTRKACTFGTATTADPSVITNSASPASFVTNASGTIAGAFLCSVTSGTAGTLFSESDFTGGDRPVASGDTVNVTYTFNLDAL